jgi:hypothetical protein
MDKNLTESVLSVCKILNKHSVQYLVAGDPDELRDILM